MRIEKDMLGELPVPKQALYGVHTVRASNNFALGYKPTNLQLIHSAATVKKAAALAYQKLGAGAPGVFPAIAQACDSILAGEADDQFPVDALQGGAGTSTNMNVNEVIANIALRILGKEYGQYEFVHPLDDVNRGQSTNDVYPTALRITAIARLRELAQACELLQQSLLRRAEEFADIPKLGRTELMDAVPITLGAEFAAYAHAIARDVRRLHDAEVHLCQVNIGGTAVGLGHTADPEYRKEVVVQLRELTGYDLSVPEDAMDATQNQDVFAEVSGLLKALAVNMMKIAGDLRLMNAGPYGGLGEISLAPMQAGSSIMPGKVNPVIPEMMMQVGIKVLGNDTAITVACSRGEFELNAFEPLIADALLESIKLLQGAVTLARTKCVDILKANPERCAHLLDSSFAFAAEYITIVGYDAVSSQIRLNNADVAKTRAALDQMIREKANKS